MWKKRGLHVVYTWYTRGIHVVYTWYTRGLHVVQQLLLICHVIVLFGDKTYVLLNQLIIVKGDNFAKISLNSIDYTIKLLQIYSLLKICKLLQIYNLLKICKLLQIYTSD